MNKTMTINQGQNQGHSQNQHEPQALKFSKAVSRCMSSTETDHVAGKLTAFETDLIESSTGQVAVAIQQAMDALRIAQEVPHGAADVSLMYAHLSPLDADLMAYIALNTLAVSVVSDGTRQSALVSIGEQIEMEVWRMDFQNADPAHFEQLVTLAKQSVDHEAYRTEALKLVSTRDNPSYVSWTDEYRAGVGQALLDTVLTATDIFASSGHSVTW